jgi:hypothetical protein
MTGSYDCSYVPPLFKVQVSAAHMVHFILAPELNSVLPEMSFFLKISTLYESARSQICVCPPESHLPEFPPIFIIPFALRIIYIVPKSITKHHFKTLN